MKRILICFLILILSFSLFAKGEMESEGKIKVAALKGPTAMGLAPMMVEENDKYEFVIVASPTELTPLLVKGEVDIAALPANLASIIYKNTKGDISTLAINTLGVLYLVEKGNAITSVEDVIGKTIYSAGKGSTPEYVLLHLLDQLNLEVGKDVFIEWKAEHAECIASISANTDAIALLPEPFVTTAKMKDKDIRVLVDLNDLWSETMDGAELVTGVVVARNNFINENQNKVKDFLVSYKNSVDFVNTNIAEGAKIIASFNIVPEAVAKTAIPKCNIVCITGTEMKNNLSSYLQVLYKANPQSIGGNLPKDEFYF